MEVNTDLDKQEKMLWPANDINKKVKFEIEDNTDPYADSNPYNQNLMTNLNANNGSGQKSNLGASITRRKSLQNLNTSLEQRDELVLPDIHTNPD